MKTEDREESTHPAEGAAARSPLIQSCRSDSPGVHIEQPTTHSVPSSSGRSASTLSGGAALHKFCACFSPQPSTAVHAYASYIPWIRSAKNLAKKMGNADCKRSFSFSPRLVLVWTSLSCGIMVRSCGSIQQRNSWPRDGRRDKSPPLCALVSHEIATYISVSSYDFQTDFQRAWMSQATETSQ